MLKIEYIADLEELAITVQGNTLYLPIQNSVDLIKYLHNGDGDLQNLPKTFFAKVEPFSHSSGAEIVLPILNNEERAQLALLIQEQLELHRFQDLDLCEYYEAPQKPFNLVATHLLSEKLSQKWECLHNEVNIIQIDTLLPREDFDNFREMIEFQEDFLPAFQRSFQQLIEYADAHQHQINFFLVRNQKHTFTIVNIQNDFFMLDSAGQRYGKSKVTFHHLPDFPSYLGLHEVPYTNMFLEYLKQHSEKRLFFNLNSLQQDMTNCYTFSVDFINSFCQHLNNMPVSTDRVEKFHTYLQSFFPVQLEENPQIFEEGSLEVLFAFQTTLAIAHDQENSDFPEPLNDMTPKNLVASFSYVNTISQEIDEVAVANLQMSGFDPKIYGRRQILPPEMLRSCQLPTFIEQTRRISSQAFSKIETFDDKQVHTLQEDLTNYTRERYLRNKDGTVVRKKINCRIKDLRKTQEDELLVMKREHPPPTNIHLMAQKACEPGYTTVIVAECRSVETNTVDESDEVLSRKHLSNSENKNTKKMIRE